MSALLDAALSYVRRGWAVVPDHGIDGLGRCTCADTNCHSPGKHPRMERESSNAHLRRQGSKDPHQVEAWWRSWPNSNVAIICGSLSGIVVVDIDPKNGGNESLRTLALPLTLSVASGGGGRHFYFRHPGGIVVRNRIGLRPGVDIKSDGGRIVAPPSNHASGGKYMWEVPEMFQNKDALAPLPRWLLNIIQTQPGTGTRRALGIRQQNGWRNR